VATSRIADSVGRVLGDRYRLTRPLGVGASAHVYVGEDVSLRRLVAIKVLHPALAGDAAFLRRFQAEARVVAALRHPNILRVYDWGEDDGAPYLVMELLAGGSLRALLDRGQVLSPAQAAAVGADAARALDYAHRRGLVHRDIKPANLIFDEEGRLTVADFGLARALAEATWTEPAGAVVGTARYAAPEQVRGQSLDSRADVYALGLVLVEATTGVVPFAADTTLATLMGRVDRPVHVPADLGPLGPVLESAGAIEPADRPDALTLARALDGVVARLPPPQPLPLAGALTGTGIEADSAPTDYPGRPRLFDGATADDDHASRETESATKLDARTGFSAGEVPREALSSTRREGLPPAQPGDLLASAPDGPPVDDGHPGPNGASGATRPPPGVATAPAAGLSGAGAGLSGGAADAPGAAGGAPIRAKGRGRRRNPLRRWRRGRWLVAGVAAVLLVAVAVAAALHFTGALTPSHPVPNLTGSSQAAAAARLRPLHLHLQVAGARYDGRAPAGTVISQHPVTGRLKEGDTIAVTLSRGPQPVAVPNVQGLTAADASALLQRLGLKVAASRHSSMTVPAGTVISSTPNGGTLLPGQTVDLVVSTGKPTVAVPAVVGASLTTAQSSLAGAGLGVSEQTAYSDSVPKGSVISTLPAAGTAATVGSPVTVVVSLGPHVVAVPNVAGESVGAASQTLGAAGFEISGVTGNPIATVTSSSPPAGTLVHYGAAIQIVTN
jgi:eukaryotic-like serine/threonine-protein kinase